VVTAATAGRASVRVHQGNWAGAAADAAQVPRAFVYRMPYYDIGDEYQFNRTAWASMATPYRAHTVWNTWYKAYYDETKDPRVAYRATTELGSGAVEGIGRVNWSPQMKYASKLSPILLSSGREMQLILAESRLRQNDWQGAITLINELRAETRVAPVTARSSDEAWTLLKRERGIELWLEGRRLGDLRRWKAGNTPGALSPLEQPGAASYLKAQDLCFPISRSELDTNPNLRS
jgi:starch-binding outer membrane protein, SusD/RagB family